MSCHIRSTTNARYYAEAITVPEQYSWRESLCSLVIVCMYKTASLAGDVWIIVRTAIVGESRSAAHSDDEILKEGRSAIDEAYVPRAIKHASPIRVFISLFVGGIIKKQSRTDSIDSVDAALTSLWRRFDAALTQLWRNFDAALTQRWSSVDAIISLRIMESEQMSRLHACCQPLLRRTTFSWTPASCCFRDWEDPPRVFVNRSSGGRGTSEGLRANLQENN